MDTKEDGKACCDKSKCCSKAGWAIALLLVGAVGGFFAGRVCKTHCDTKAAAEASAPATPAPAAKTAK